VPMDGASFEVATFRADGPYLDGRHPSTVSFTNAREDALRRDFTVNALFYDPTFNKILDYVKGLKDLEARIIRAVGDPKLRFEEDKLRILRAVRFVSQLGFEIDPATAAAGKELASELYVVSKERITEELRKLAMGQHLKKAIQLAFDL